MCGIAGWVNTKKDISHNIDIVEGMTDKLVSRGPDSSGFYENENIILGHRRLIIVDAKGGAQPMTKQLGEHKFVLVYNGELYNTDEVRGELKSKGYRFESYSDTEVLLVSYIEWGHECVNHINGIFAFDHRRRPGGL